MTKERCNHCGFQVTPGQGKCPNCGTPLAQDEQGHTPKRFLVFFVLLVVFALVMAIILPR